MLSLQNADVTDTARLSKTATVYTNTDGFLILLQSGRSFLQLTRSNQVVVFSGCLLMKSGYSTAFFS